jgi:hypothetical protein
MDNIIKKLYHTFAQPKVKKNIIRSTSEQYKELLAFAPLGK